MRSLLLCDLRDPAPVVQLARENGLGVEFQSFYIPSVLDDSSSALAEHRALLVDLAGPRSMHAPFIGLAPGCADPLIQDVTRTRLLQGLAIADELGILDVVCHLGYAPHSPPDEWLDQATAFWQALLPEAQPGIHIHLENMIEERPDLQLALVERVADARLGICLDIGHAHALSRLPVVEWIKALDKQLTYVHLHDNYGTADEHLPLGQGSVPLPGVLEALETRAPGAIWAIEANAEPSLRWLADHHLARQDP